jgi:hypothetical protein
MRYFIQFFFIILLSLTSCEGMNEIQGVVLNDVTKQPVENVKIIYFSKHSNVASHTDSTCSDSLGRFNIGELVMCTPNCPDVEITFSKSGFQPLKKIFQKKVVHANLIIYLKPN